MDKNKKAILFLIFTTLFWGGNFVVGKLVVSTVPPFVMAFIRWGIALIFLIPLLFRGGMPSKALLQKHWKSILTMSITGVFGFNTLVYFAVQYTTSVNASLVNALSPVIILILSSIILHERLNGIQLFGAIFSFIGVLIVVSHGTIQTFLQFQFNTGDILMVIAVILWAVYSIVMKKVTVHIPSLSIIAINALIGWLLIMPFAIWEWTQTELIRFDFTSSVGLLYIGIFASFLAFLWWNEGVIHLGPSKAGVFLNLIPVFAAILSPLILKEGLSSNQLIGGLIVIVGVFITNFDRSNLFLKRNVKNIGRRESDNESTRIDSIS